MKLTSRLLTECVLCPAVFSVWRFTAASNRVFLPLQECGRYWSWMKTRAPLSCSPAIRVAIPVSLCRYDAAAWSESTTLP